MLIIIYISISFLYSAHKFKEYYDFKTIYLMSDEEIEKTLEFFDVTATDNIKIDKLGYDPKKQRVYLLIYDVKDINKLYFDNLGEYNCTEEDFNSVFDVPFENFGMVCSNFSVQYFQGTSDVLEKNGIKTKLFIYKTEKYLCCELEKNIDIRNIYSEINELRQK